MTSSNVSYIVVDGSELYLRCLIHNFVCNTLKEGTKNHQMRTETLLSGELPFPVASLCEPKLESRAMSSPNERHFQNMCICIYVESRDVPQHQQLDNLGGTTEHVH